MTLVPELQMLWEDSNAADVIDERFGFRDAEAADAWVRAFVLQHWGIDIVSCDRIVISDRNALAWVRSADGRWILKWSVNPDRFQRLATLAKLMAWLNVEGLPVVPPRASLSGELQIEEATRSANLQPVIEGTHLDVTDPELVFDAGVCLARLHTTLRDYAPDKPISGLAPPHKSFRDQVEGWLGEQDPATGSPALARLREWLEAAPEQTMPVQLVHGDFRAANVLCDANGLTAVIDFEEVRLEQRVMELARSSVLLGTLFRGWGPVPVAVKSQFVAGYQSILSLSQQESQWLEVLVAWLSLVFFPRDTDPREWGQVTSR